MTLGDISPSAASGYSVPRSVTSTGFLPVKRTRSFYLPPGGMVRSRSVGLAAGWEEAPYPRPHRGRFGALIDFLLAIYHEIPVLAPLITKLIRFIGLGIKAYAMLFRLIAFAISLSPAIAKAGAWWWRSRTISRGIQYGTNARNFLDVYHVVDNEDSDSSVKRPVVVYITGGAWIIGYKAWAAPLGEYLSKHNVILVSVDYRNFPQGTLKDMQVDVEAAIDWVWNNIDRFGGDRSQIFLVGQSAGAQILSTVILKRASNLPTDRFNTTMPVQSIKKFIGVSGPYDIVALAPLMNKRGLYHSMLRVIMDNDLFSASPQRVLTGMTRAAIDRLPPVLLLHGTSDNTVPYSSSVDFFEIMKKFEIKVELELWPNVTHSEPLVEAVAAGSNFFGSRLVLEATGEEGCAKSEPLMDERLIRIAKFFMPF
jgi:prenylcysteine alpha-carboxyl methylesterase